MGWERIARTQLTSSQLIGSCARPQTGCGWEAELVSRNLRLYCVLGFLIGTKEISRTVSRCALPVHFSSRRCGHMGVSTVGRLGIESVGSDRPVIKESTSWDLGGTEVCT